MPHPDEIPTAPGQRLLCPASGRGSGRCGRFFFVAPRAFALYARALALEDGSPPGDLEIDHRCQRCKSHIRIRFAPAASPP